jgi:GNAT superfamily N-acetyltransferase
MSRNSGPINLASPRWSQIEDAEALAALHCETWRYAYAGIIPGPGLERMLSRRGPGWWRRLHAGGGRALVLADDRALTAYALVGRCRGGAGGEIQELYVRPAWQGLGFGGLLFDASRAALAARGLKPLTVWCLAENRIGCAFYRSRGGQETGRALDRVAGALLEKRRFAWS